MSWSRSGSSGREGARPTWRVEGGKVTRHPNLQAIPLGPRIADDRRVVRRKRLVGPDVVVEGRLRAGRSAGALEEVGHDLVEDGSGQGAAEHAGAGLLDEDGDDVLRGLRRSEADEGCREAVVALELVVVAVGGAGLARDAVALDAGGARRAVLAGDLIHHPRQLDRGVLGDDAG